MLAKKKNVKFDLGKCLLHHDAPFKIKWDLVVIILVVYNALKIPLDVSFPAFEKIDKKIAVEIVEDCIDFTFLLDIIISFRTTYVSPTSGLEILD